MREKHLKSRWLALTTRVDAVIMVVVSLVLVLHVIGAAAIIDRRDSTRAAATSLSSGD